MSLLFTGVYGKYREITLINLSGVLGLVVALIAYGTPMSKKSRPLSIWRPTKRLQGRRASAA